MSINDQYTMGRIPIRPLSLTEKELAQTKEFIIDNLGDEPTYHMYVVDSEDRTQLIDLTELIIQEAFPNINGDNIKVSIEGLVDSQKLKDLLNFIYKRFLMPDDPNGFDYEEDYKKIIDPLTKNVLLKDTDGVIYLPITTAENVYDSSGTSIQDRLNSMSKIGFSSTYVRSENSSGQSTFQIEYPFPDYMSSGNYMEIRIGSTYVDKSRYELIDEQSGDGHVYRGTLTLIDELLENNRAINILFMYNSSTGSGNNIKYMSGAYIANYSIPYSKLEKISDRYDLSDSTSIATSKAVYNLYKFCCTALNIDPSTGSGETTGGYKLSTNRSVYTAEADGVNTMSYSSLEFIAGDEHNIFVYRNGVRLFESIDYSINIKAKTITTFVDVEKYEKFIFEYHMVEKR